MTPITPSIKDAMVSGIPPSSLGIETPNDVWSDLFWSDGDTIYHKGMPSDVLDQRARAAIGHGLPALREAAYRARRILRSHAVGRPRKLTKPGFNNERDNRLLDKFVRILPPLLATECVAEAEARAIQIVIKEYEDELQAR